MKNCKKTQRHRKKDLFNYCNIELPRGWVKRGKIKSVEIIEIDGNLILSNSHRASNSVNKIRRKLTPHLKEYNEEKDSDKITIDELNKRERPPGVDEINDISNKGGI